MKIIRKYNKKINSNSSEEEKICVLGKRVSVDICGEPEKQLGYFIGYSYNTLIVFFDNKRYGWDAHFHHSQIFVNKINDKNVTRGWFVNSLEVID